MIEDIHLCRVCGIEFAADDRHNCLGDRRQKTQDRIKLEARILALWSQGLMSGADIGARLGLSRSAVMGALYRARHSGKVVRSHPKAPSAPDPQKRPQKTADIRRPKSAPTKRLRAKPPPAPAPAKPQRLKLPKVDPNVHSILYLTPWTCRWPIGDPRKDNFRYCLIQKLDALRPYCDHHAKMHKAPRH